MHWGTQGATASLLINKRCVSPTLCFQLALLCFTLPFPPFIFILHHITFLSLGFHTVPCLPKGEALETYNDDATTPCPASFAQGRRERGSLSIKLQRQQTPTPVMGCEQPASWCLCPRVRASLRLGSCHCPPVGSVGTCLQSLPASPPQSRWSGPSSVYRASSCATIYSPLFSPPGLCDAV